MKHAFSIDTFLPANLATGLGHAEQTKLTEQREVLAIAFEQKIQTLSKDQLLNLKFYIKTYLDLEPGADKDLYTRYLYLINLSLQNGIL